MRFLFLLFFAIPALADPKLISFEAFVQFSDGTNFVLNHGGENTSVKYGTPIYEDTQLKLERAASTVKFVTRANCVVVVYGEGGVVASQGEKPWRITTQAARFICPDKNEEKFIFRGVEITPRGETLFESSGKIFVIVGNAKLNQVLPARRIYQYSKGVIEVAQQSALAQYEFDNLYKPPREAEKLAKPKVNATPDKYRIEMGPLTGPAVLVHANGYLNHYDYSSSGPRVQLSFKDNLAGIIIGLRYLETQSQNQGGNLNYNLASTSDRLHTFGADVGYRFDFDRWWSPFIRAGVIWSRNEVNINSPAAIGCTGNCSGYYSDQVLDYFGVSANIGIDALLRPSWLGGFGVFASAELELDQTIHPTSGAEKNSQNGGGSAPNEATNEHGFIANINGLVNFGILYQF